MQAECLVARLRLQRQYSLYAGQMKTHGVHHWSAPFEVRRLVRHWLPRVFRSAFEHCVGRQNVRNYRAPPVEMLDVYPPKSIGSVERESGTAGEAELNRCLRCRGIRNVDSLGPVRGKGVPTASLRPCPLGTFNSGVAGAAQGQRVCDTRRFAIPAGSSLLFIIDLQIV
jgi:hypothetical protein